MGLGLIGRGTGLCCEQTGKPSLKTHFQSSLRPHSCLGSGSSPEDEESLEVSIGKSRLGPAHALLADWSTPHCPASLRSPQPPALLNPQHLAHGPAQRRHQGTADWPSERSSFVIIRLGFPSAHRGQSGITHSRRARQLRPRASSPGREIRSGNRTTA